MDAQRNQARGPWRHAASQCWPIQGSPAEVKLQVPVKSLRGDLCNAISEMKSPKNENETLTQQVNLLKTEQRHAGSQHKEELTRKDEQIKQGHKKRFVWTKTNCRTLALLAKAKKDTKTTKGQWRSRFQLFEASLHQEMDKKVKQVERDRQRFMESWIREEEERKKNERMKEHVSLLTDQIQTLGMNRGAQECSAQTKHEDVDIEQGLGNATEKDHGNVVHNGHDELRFERGNK